ncbi:aminotransferase class I/II-fold pyridoxal phosphate-dependent enzyme [Haloglycomyces albus]|uniref:aminotransferase class I/II-fold pyridoxal phosphate-dependent enzyme n=1 Tax=Haloglycomyces albus TaxID=526067 RepID=UPI00046CD9AA|nr:8-amino-7-oxononanoate synthase [Haloglycomyces albus]
MTHRLWQRLEQKARLRRQRGLNRNVESRSDLTDLASNDYLGLSTHPDVIAAAREALTHYGLGAGSSRAVRGTTDIHRRLEHELAALTGQDEALLYSSGYMANLGALTALGSVAPRGRTFLFDAHVHASLHDAARMTNLQVESFRHNDLQDLETQLETHRPFLVAVESVYSVLGDRAPLQEIQRLCSAYDALLVVDEAHALGVVGTRGGGLSGSVDGDNIVVTGTLSKALASAGGFVSGPRSLRAHLTDTSRPFIYDTAPPPATIAGALAALERSTEAVGARNVIRRRIATAARRFHVAESEGAILSIPAGDADTASRWARHVSERGVAVGCFRPPSTPDHVSRLRLTINTSVSEAEFDAALTTIEKERDV